MHDLESYLETLTGGEIAIIGMSCRFPGANDVDSFWQNLRDGVESISQLSDDDLSQEGVSPSERSNPNYVKAAPILDRVEWFDAAFFGYSPLEAEIMDPQHRIFLECAWEAMEHGGYNPYTFADSVGVYGGARTNTYVFNIVSNLDLFKSLGVFQVSIGNDLASLATGVSYRLNLRGPAYAVHTACSTALVAIHLACQSLLIDECQMALAGGVAVNVPHKVGYIYDQAGILSPDGHCRAFDTQAQGTVFGSGAGVVLLKRLEDAIEDGDTIHAVIKGSAANNDGSKKATFTAPSVEGQTKVILNALAEAEVNPDTISYVEAHATATPLGDPIEVRALTKAFRTSTERNQFCAIGSVKSNVGHLDAAAGMPALIKTIMSMKYRQLPPTLHYTRPNPQIDFATTPFFVNSRLRDWIPEGGLPRRAGISSFGFGGTNAHIILEEAPVSLPASGPSRPFQLLPLSARTETALEVMAQNLASFVQDNKGVSLADMAYTLQVGRHSFEHRQVLVARDVDETLDLLSDMDGGAWATFTPEMVDRPVVFMFSGQGSQYADMGKGIYREEAVFRDAVDRCAEILAPLLGFDVRKVLYEGRGTLQNTAVAQPALFVIEYALAMLWKSWGIIPAAMIGHSIGEYTAACLAGVLTLEDALYLVAERGRLMQSLSTGGMLTVSLPEADIYPLLGGELSLAAINSPNSCVVSGEDVAIDALVETLLAQEIPHHRLHTSHAFHSTMMEPILAAFAQIVASTTRNEPQIPYISNVTGMWITSEQVMDPAYWAQHLRRAVRFFDGVDELLKNPAYLLLEVGPGNTLSKLVRQHPKATTAVHTIRHPKDTRDDMATLLMALGRLWLEGAAIDWKRLWVDEDRHRISLPTYPFERKRYWVEPNMGNLALLMEEVAVPQKQAKDRWFYVPVWQEQDQEKTAVSPDMRWLVFASNQAVSQQLLKVLHEEKQTVITVFPSDTYQWSDDLICTLNPEERGDYNTLLQELDRKGYTPQAVVHLWNWQEYGSEQPDSTASFYSLLHFVQACETQGITTPILLGVVSNQLHQVTVDDHPFGADRALLLGPCRVVPKEYPHILCRNIDVDAADGVPLSIFEEMLTSTDTVAVAYRQNKRYVLTYEQTELAPTTDVQIRSDGVYLITGGLGGVGMVIAASLAKQGARLVLTGRSEFPPRDEWDSWLTTHPVDDRTSRRIQQVQALEGLGTDVLPLQADVTNLVQMQAVHDEIMRQFGQLHGIIHAAGIAGGGIIQLKTRDVANHVIAPKVMGLQILHRVFYNTNLDFVQLFSSIGAVLGEMGQVDYCGANAVLNAFAPTTDWPVMSIAWDDWQSVGLSVETELPPDLQVWRSQMLAQALTNEEGAEVFLRLLGQQPPMVIVSTRDLSERIALSEQFTRSSVMQDMGETAVSQAIPPIIQSSPAELERQIIEIWQKVLGVSYVGLTDNFFDLGGDSLSGMQLISELRRTFNVQISPVALFEAPTVQALVNMFAPKESKDPTRRERSRSGLTETDVAIVGMSGRFPGANDLDTFWRNLCEGVEAVTFFSNAELLEAGVHPQTLQDPQYVKARPILEGVEMFDAAFFGYSPREAQLMDPQHRVFLETAWHALEHAGYDPERYEGAIGVYAGASLSTYLLNLYTNADLLENLDPLQATIGNDSDSLATSVSYKLNLQGPSVSVQTFCSTSLVAVHMAARSLLWGECDMVLAGGVTILLPQVSGYQYRIGSILSPDGHNRTFDEQAQGTLFGNGVGVVVLKRLSAALADGDQIYAVIKGSAINNDGSLKVGYTAPSVEGQADVIASAQEVAGVTPDSIHYIEAHGTATALGDPIEIAALTKAFRRRTTKQNFCAIGSIKTNVGHLDRAAGIAGLIKTALSLKYQKLPPTLHFTNPNPKIDFDNSPFYVNNTLADWPVNGEPRRAGVSALGFGGTNAHIILEEAPDMSVSDAGREWHLLLLSAQDETALTEMIRNLALFLQQNPTVNLADVAYTLQVGRHVFDHRCMLVCRDVESGFVALSDPVPPQVLSRVQERRQRPIIFLFSGQGSQYTGMGCGLYETEPVFRRWIDYCSDTIQVELGLDLRDVLYGDGDNETLAHTAITQPALFVVEYALAQLWLSWGVSPQGMIGHSIGEYVAAVLAGVFSLEDALHLVVERGRLMQSMPTGEMLTVSLPEDALLSLLPHGAEVGAVNGPNRCVASGTPTAIDALETLLQAKEIPCRRLHTSHAFHSAMMDPILEQFAESVRQIPRQVPTLPYISNRTGTWITDEEATDPTYWAEHLRHTVRFSDGLQQLLEEPEQVFLEIGPGHTLTTLARLHSAWQTQHMAIPSLPHPKDPQNDLLTLGQAIGQLWLVNVPFSWEQFYEGQTRHRLPLPVYPFQRERYWIELNQGKGSPQNGSFNPTMGEWFYVPSWKRSTMPQPAAASAQTWLVFIDQQGIAQSVCNKLTEREVIQVRFGNKSEQIDRQVFVLADNDYGWLLRTLISQDRLPTAVLYALALDAPEVTLPANIIDTQFKPLWALLEAVENVPAIESVWMLTQAVYEISGDETLTLDGAVVRDLLHEAHTHWPKLRCHQIDVTLSNPNRIAMQIAQEIQSEASVRVVAYRGQYRWLPIVEPLPGLPEAQSPKTSYLVANGLANAHLTILSELVDQGINRLVLLESAWMPAAPDVWRDTDPQDVQQLAQLHQQQAKSFTLPEAMTWPISTPQFTELEALTNQLCTRAICDYLHTHGILVQQGKTYGIETVRRQLRILNKYAQLYRFMLVVLVEDGVITQTDEAFTCQKSLKDLPSANNLKQILNQQYPEAAAGYQALEHCLTHYDKVLTGEMDAVRVLYPNGSDEMVRAIEKNQLQFSNLSACRQKLVSTIEQLSDGQPVRILEIGAGAGQVTWPIVEAIQEKRNVSYHFTDITKSFLLDAERHAQQAGFDFVTFSLFDVSHPPQQQGISLYSYDLVIASEVLHATPYLATTLAHVGQLLRPKGGLFILEATRAQRWANMVWGLLEGWWQFTDTQIRQYTPLVSGSIWQDLLTEQGFSQVQDCVAKETADYTLLYAQQSAYLTEDTYQMWLQTHFRPQVQTMQARLEQLQQLIKKGVDVTLYIVDWSQPDLIDPLPAVAGVICVNTDEIDLYTRMITPTAIAQMIDPSTPVLLYSVCSLSKTSGFLENIAARNQRIRGNWHIVWSDMRYQMTLTLSYRQKLWACLLSEAAPPSLYVSPQDLLLEAWNEFPPEKVAGNDLPAVSRPTNLQTTYVAPRDEIEQQIANVWEDILGITPIGIHDDFLMLGGDSLMVTQLVTRLRPILQVDISFEKFFENSTIASLGRAIQTLRADKEERLALELLSRLESLSPEEVTAELQHRQHVQ